MRCERLEEGTAVSCSAPRSSTATDGLCPDAAAPCHIPHAVFDEVCQQASGSADGQLGQVIAATLVRHAVNWRNVGLDEMKQLVVTATIASRRV